MKNNKDTNFGNSELKFKDNFENESYINAKYVKINDLEPDKGLEKIKNNNNIELFNLKIIQRKTSRSLLRVKYIQDKIQLFFFFLGLFGLSVVSWSLSWIIGRVIKKPKTYRGRKLRQLNGTLSLLFILFISIFSNLYYHSIGKHLKK